MSCNNEICSDIVLCGFFQHCAASVKLKPHKGDNPEGPVQQKKKYYELTHTHTHTSRDKNKRNDFLHFSENTNIQYL